LSILFVRFFSSVLVVREYHLRTTFNPLREVPRVCVAEGLAHLATFNPLREVRLKAAAFPGTADHLSILFVRFCRACSPRPGP
ncbi:MAG: hypothetical protein NZ953_04410, partial [Thaumarchaeota archaeon]|nr:hypothetical protein [Candidatus Calditenuaceae archaeon]